jgi:hypothetical protein
MQGEGGEDGRVEGGERHEAGANLSWTSQARTRHHSTIKNIWDGSLSKPVMDCLPPIPTPFLLCCCVVAAKRAPCLHGRLRPPTPTPQLRYNRRPVLLLPPSPRSTIPSPISTFSKFLATAQFILSIVFLLTTVACIYPPFLLLSSFIFCS